MAGIDTELRMREMAAGGNPQAAQQRYAQSKSLMDLLVAQKVSNDYASARNAMQAATQAPAGTVRDQLDMSNAQVTKNDMMRSVMPGVQMKAARDSQAMQRRAMGVPSQPAPNIRMADGGIVGYKDGGLLDRIMNYIRSIEFGGTSREADQYNREVMEALNQRDIGRRVETPPPMPRPDDRAPRAAVSGAPTRAEKFSQMFPKAREAVNQGDGSAMGGLKYLQMVGRKQQEAKEEEARRAANYIKMLARSQDMIDEVDPANTLPPEITAFAPGGGVEGGSSITEDFDIGRGPFEAAYDFIVSQIGSEGRRRQEEETQRQAIREQYPDASRSQVEAALAVQRYGRGATTPTPTTTDTGVTKEQFDAATAGPAIPKDEQKFITDPTAIDVLRQLQTGPVRPQEEPEEKKGIFDNVDIGRLQAFLAGGAGQTSTAGALGGGLRGLMGEDQRREGLASKEAIEAAKIASQRYGAQLDYDAALARLDQDERNSIRSAQTDLIEKKLGAEASAAEKVLDFVVESDNVFNQQAMMIMEQYGDNPAMAGAQLTALLDERLDANMGPIRRQISGLGGSSAGAGEFPDLGTDED
jgi:hypothetical protein